jgi:hypothetical protein
MSPRSNDDAPVGLYRKPRADLYTVMLVVALLALIVAAVFLYLEAAFFGPTPTGAPSVKTGMLWNSPAAGLAADRLLSTGVRLPSEASPVSG